QGNDDDTGQHHAVTKPRKPQGRRISRLRRFQGAELDGIAVAARTGSHRGAPRARHRSLLARLCRTRRSDGVTMNMDALKRDLDGLKIEDNAKLVQQKSRDFYWYSPVLKRQLDAVTADLVVT